MSNVNTYVVAANDDSILFQELEESRIVCCKIPKELDHMAHIQRGEFFPAVFFNSKIETG